MPVNDIKPFGIGPGDDATPQIEYAAATWRIEGWRSGILPHEQINKVLRQTSLIAAAIAQTIVDFTQQDLLDAGQNLTAVTNLVKLAFSANLPFNPAGTYPVGSIGYAIQNGLGSGGAMTAAQIRAILTGQLTEIEFTAIIQGRLNLIDAPTTGLVTKVADLQTVFGTTTAAANSAAAAANSAIDALASRNAAAVSAGAALTSETNANNSRTAAATSAGNAAVSAGQAASSQTSAAGSASTASTSASTASGAATTATNAAAAAAASQASAATSATDAGTFASAADGSRTQAATSAGNASTSANAASSSASSAAGSAATATTKAAQAASSEGAAASSANAAGISATTASTQASIATTQASIATTKAIEASTSASNASGFATAAANSASSALTSSGEAGSSAAAANSSSVSAAASAATATAALGQTARANMIYRTLTDGNPPFVARATDFSWGSSGWGLLIGANGVDAFVAGVAMAGLLTPGVQYSVSFLAKMSSGPSANLFVDLFPDTLPQTSVGPVTSTPTLFKWEGFSSSNGDITSALLRFFTTMPNGSLMELTDIKFEQNTVATPFVLNPRDVTYYAQAAATSASSASASANAAATSASASQTSRLAAESAAGAASSSQIAAAGSATTATGAASTATTASTNAASASSAAGGSASAANISASSASASAGQAAGSASAAASWYDQTVSATGSLTALVATKADTSVVTDINTRLTTTEANLLFKVAATRADGKKVIGGIGLAATATGNIGQSEILLQADKLVFVPSSDPNAPLTSLFTVGQVNGVSTLVVGQGVFGDATIRSAAIVSLEADKIVARTITSDKFALTSGTVAQADNSGAGFTSQVVQGSGGYYSEVRLANAASPYTSNGFPLQGKLLGVVTVPFDGQTLHASVSGFLSLAFGPNWSGASVGLHGIDAQLFLNVFRLQSGVNVGPNAVKSAFANSRDITYLAVDLNRRIPFSIACGYAAVPAGTYVLTLTAFVNATQGDTSTPLPCFDPPNCFIPHSFHVFLNGI